MPIFDILFEMGVHFSDTPQELIPYLEVIGLQILLSSRICLLFSFCHRTRSSGTAASYQRSHWKTWLYPAVIHKTFKDQYLMSCISLSSSSISSSPSSSENREEKIFLASAIFPAKLDSITKSAMPYSIFSQVYHDMQNLYDQETPQLHSGISN